MEEQQMQSKVPFEKYPSADIILQMVIDEFNAEYERMTALDTKAGLLVTVFTAIFTFFLSSLDLSLLLKESSCVSIVLIVIYALACLVSIYAIFLLYQTLKLQDYKRMKSNLLSNERLAMSDSSTVKRGISSILAKYCEDNIKTNDMKVKAYTKARRWSLIAVFLICISFLMTNIFVGKEESVCVQVIIQNPIVMGQQIRI